MTSLLVGKMKLDLDETIVVFLEVERLMKQESSDTSDGSAFVVHARDTEKKYVKKHSPNIRWFYCEEFGHIQFMCPKARENLRELKKNQGGSSVSLVGADEDVLLLGREDREFIPWKSEDDPATSNYIDRVDKNGYPQLILWKDSVPLYRTGPWIGSRFSGLPIRKNNEIYTSKFVITETEAYFVSHLVNTSESSPITRLTLSPGGIPTRYVWNREKREWTQYLTLLVIDCDRYGICGPNGVCNVNKSPRCECMEGFDPKSSEDWAQGDWTDGCSRKFQLECGNGDGFLKYTGIKLPDTRWSWYNMSMNLVECEEKCLKDCNCTAYSNTDIRDGGSGCLLWFGGLNDMRGYSDDGQDLYVRMPQSELSK
ncbi:G-type lectin S-receptor-like serine/threonine-protein kinase At4g27290 [Apium graveolens]|uniref:G-type lectin S-receptor-like serine/threonine-protein kinase At4g27290 n=1 Tax=Apium graveolens TaxID=4045 RepID=UPI003D7C02CA